MIICDLVAHFCDLHVRFDNEDIVSKASLGQLGRG